MRLELDVGQYALFSDQKGQALPGHPAAGELDYQARAGGNPLEETWLAPGDLEVLEALIVQRGR